MDILLHITTMHKYFFIAVMTEMSKTIKYWIAKLQMYKKMNFFLLLDQ